jgi:hypothetical protein
MSMYFSLLLLSSQSPLSRVSPDVGCSCAQDKAKLGERWIDVFRSSKGEVYAVLAAKFVHAYTRTHAPHPRTHCSAHANSIDQPLD